ncbi:MAG: rhodanese-like domain-containing protein [Chloroflexi bacterium]|jgi:rhodanese-related sulfurtransferase|nr:rhodanese-like domain-containing protein [Chloroflexota bacterium]
MPRTIDRYEVQRLLQAGAQLVDVMPAAEYAEQHLPGAINLPLRQLDRLAGERLDRDRPVIVYCYDNQ